MPSTAKKPTPEEIIRYLNQQFDEYMQKFDIANKADVAINFVFDFWLHMDEEWISQMEQRLKREISDVEKFRINVFYRVYYFHGQGLDPRHGGEVFNE